WHGDAVAAARFGSPAEIRAALLPEQQADFDIAYESALNEARSTLRLDALQHVLRAWRRMALLTEQEPDEQREMLAARAEIQETGGPRPGSTPWGDLKTQLGL
ncbi:DUF6247 family protein, partial [Kibdelosporangium lantanae]